MSLWLHSNAMVATAGGFGGTRTRPSFGGGGVIGAIAAVAEPEPELACVLDCFVHAVSASANMKTWVRDFNEVPIASCLS
jgi:hypothetical protein